MSNKKSNLEKTYEAADALIEKLQKATNYLGGQQRNPVPSLPKGWNHDPDTNAFHHSVHGVVSPGKQPDGTFKPVHNGGVLGTFSNAVDAGAAIGQHIRSLKGTQTNMANFASDPNTQKSDEDDVEKSGYGPKGMSQYNPADNAKRKANNTGEVVGEGPNVNAKAYSTKPGQLSGKQQAAVEQKKVKQLSGPVKQYSPEQIAEMNRKRGLVKSWASHAPVPAADPSLLKSKHQETGEETAARRLGELMAGRGMLDPKFGQQPPPQPTDEQMFGHLVTRPEDLQKKEQEWGNVMNNWLTEATKPISARFNSEEEEMAYWKSIKVQDSDSGSSGY